MPGLVDYVEEAWEDLDCVFRNYVHVTADNPNPYWMDFEILEEEDYKGEQVLICRGFIKWDGCSKWEFNNHVHICGIDHAEKVCAMIFRVFLKMKSHVEPHNLWLWGEGKPDGSQ